MSQHSLSELEELEQIYCEMHKDVYGVKARWYRAESVEAARRDIENLHSAMEVIAAQEKELQETCIREFEDRVRTLIEAGAGDRETAIRWLHQAEDTDGSSTSLEHALGLPYYYLSQGDQRAQLMA